MALTSEQQQALDELMAHVAPAQTASATMPTDLLRPWLGISRQDTDQWLATLLSHKDDLERRLLSWTERNPLEATFEFLAAASVPFFAAERDANPKIRTLVDAFYYLSTCASVGYADIFAVTQTGRAIAALVMAIGPALTNKVLEHPVGK